jgi:Uncharacterized protein conserved in bacteria (DUF2188)
MCRMSDLLELHVLPDERSGTWRVGVDPARPALSSHASATDAQRAARRLAEEGGARRIHLHDRYRRVRTLMLRRD